MFEPRLKFFKFYLCTNSSCTDGNAQFKTAPFKTLRQFIKITPCIVLSAIVRISINAWCTLAYSVKPTQLLENTEYFKLLENTDYFKSKAVFENLFNIYYLQLIESIKY